jgi:hypothetical protein
VLLHWWLLGYSHPFGGQQTDDDYYYYGFAARMSADHPLDVTAHRGEVPPDRLGTVLLAAKYNFFFANLWPYPAWAAVMYGLTRPFGLSYQTAALALFVVQTGLLIGGVQLLAARMTPAGHTLWWRLLAGAVVATFLGLELVPSLLISIPIHMTSALALMGLGLLVWRRWVLATVVLLGAVAVHAAGAAPAAAVLATAALHEALHPRAPRFRPLAVTGAITVTVLGAWTALHYGLLGLGHLEWSGHVEFGFVGDFVRGLILDFRKFFPVVTTAAVIACVLVYRAGGAWRLPAAVTAVCIGAMAGLVTMRSGIPHPQAYPAARFLFFLAPVLLLAIAVLTAAVAASARTLKPAARAVALACGVAALGAGMFQSAVVVRHQLSARPAMSLGRLYAHMASLAADPQLPHTGFVFVNPNFGSVLSAAHLYEGRYLWARVYSPERLEAAAAPADRLIYLEDPADPPVRLGGFCVTGEETIRLGIDAPGVGGQSVRVVTAVRRHPAAGAPCRG